MASQRQRAAARDKVRERRLDHGGLVIAYIGPGMVSQYFTESLSATLLVEMSEVLTGARPPRLVNLLQEWSSANVSSSRNTVTQRFLDHPVGEWLLWVDADMRWSPGDIDALLAVADSETCPVVGGLCFGAADGGLVPTIYQWADLPEGLSTVRMPDYEPDALVQCAATGAAFLLIHRSVLERMKAREFNRAFPWFQETELHGKPVGEDITFCIRAGLLGIPVFVHTGVHIGHHKSWLLTSEMHRQQMDARKVGGPGGGGAG